MLNNVALVNEANRLFPNTIEQQKVMALVAAVVAVQRIPLPSSEVEDVTAYYESTHRLNVNRILSAINEVVVFDIQYAAEKVRSMYYNRYDQAFPPVLSYNGCINTFLFNRPAISEEETEFLNSGRNKEFIFLLHAAVKQFIDKKLEV